MACVNLTQNVSIANKFRPLKQDHYPAQPLHAYLTQICGLDSGFRERSARCRYQPEKASECGALRPVGPEPHQNYSALKQPQVQVVKFGCFAIKARSLLFLYNAGAHKSLQLGDSCFRGNGVTYGAKTHYIGIHGVPINLVKSDSKNVFCNLTRLSCQFIPVLNSLRALPLSRLSLALQSGDKAAASHLSDKH